MEVRAIVPLREGGRDYTPGEAVHTTPSRGWRLAELGMVMAPAPWEYDWKDEWTGLRKFIGARPQGILVFPTRRSRLEDLRPGETFLLLRKYGGLGDILISSMIFPELARQYPDIIVTYAVPRQFHPLFEGSGLRLLPYEDVFGGENHFHRGSVRPEYLERFDLIEDISIPCHVWENFFVAYGGIDEGSGLRWRNRLDMWSEWFGLRVPVGTNQAPQTCITIREEEREKARERMLTARGKNGKPSCVISPFAANRTKSYPWFEALAERIGAEGFRVFYLHDKSIPGSRVRTLAGLSYREMGAVVAVSDLVVSVDTATFHWGGILGRRTIGIFNVNDGVAYQKYYPTAQTVQVCDTPCINVRYGPGDGTCAKLTPEALPDTPGLGLSLSRCYHRKSVNQILEAVGAAFPDHSL